LSGLAQNNPQSKNNMTQTREPHKQYDKVRFSDDLVPIGAIVIHGPKVSTMLMISESVKKSSLKEKR
jgi:hypothetical protein